MSKPVSPPSKATPTDGWWRRLWQAFLTTVGAEPFFRIFSPWVKYLAWTAAALLSVGLVWGLAFAPPDSLQGNSYRIVFIHVPTASLAMSIYFAMSALGVIFLVWKINTANVVAQAIAPIGFAACALSLLTGSIWGKPTWGTYWVWDARLTSMLILLFLYAGVMALFAAFEGSQSRGKAAALLSVVGAVNLPIIKYSVEWWNTLHQGATFSVSRAPKMDVSMWVPLLLSVLGAYFLAAALGIYRTNSLLLARNANKAWVKRYFSQQTSEQ